ncbi:hypothetical protein LLE87_34180, partial [Paenibacillus polymyxa]|nr:hypothetical protein [Paenibacillus polymyxa]
FAAASRPQTRRQSRQYCGVKHGVNRDNIAGSNTASIVISSLPHRGVKFGVNPGRELGGRLTFRVRGRLG